MTWICPRCNEELGELNGWCEYCKCNEGIIVYNPDIYYIREIRIAHIQKGDKTVTPQEELFSQLFNHEKVLVKDMDTLTLRAHREELAKIAFEARARLTAVDDEDQDRKKKANDGKPKGFERSLNTDETTTNAINALKERKKNLTGKEKMLVNLIELYKKGGSSQAEAEKIASTAMGAGTILAKLKDNASKNIMLEKQTRSPLSQENGFVIQKSPKELKETTENKPIFNPFEKKS